MSSEFQDKVALVTGGANGIGKATVLALAAAGAKVVVADINLDHANTTVDAVRRAGGTARAVACDVADPAAVEGAVAAAVSEFGGLDLAVNNAGVEGTFAPITDYPHEAWNQIMGVNLTGVFSGLKYEIAQMLTSGRRGAIVNVSSVLGQAAFPTASGYVAAKHAVIGLTKAAALEVAEAGIRVNAVSPGFIETAMVMDRELGGSDADTHAAYVAMHPIGRLGQAEEVARSILWLLSDAASFITGSVLNVDGGYLAR